MIFLEFHNHAVEELLLGLFSAAKSGCRHDPVDRTLADFDNILYRLHTANADPSKVLLSVVIRFFDELRTYNVEALITREYGEYVCSEPQPGYDVSLLFDLENLPEDYVSLAQRVSLFKRNCFASVFEKFFIMQALADGPLVSERAIIHYHGDETMYVQALEDRVTVIFSTAFKDSDDIVLGKLLMQEFTEVRRRYDRAPQVLYSHRTPPSELRGVEAATGENMAYITFVLFPRHLLPSAADRTINLIHSLRNYLHYHIKCAKGFLHARMRAKTAEFLKILNRAHPEVTAEEPAVSILALGLESTPSQQVVSLQQAAENGPTCDLFASSHTDPLLGDNLHFQSPLLPSDEMGI